MKPEVLPQRQLNLTAELLRLAPPETSTKEHINATLDYLEARMESWSEEQDRRLLQAEKRVRLCAFLRPLLTGFPFTTGARHFSWCPFEAWMANGVYDARELFD